MEWLALSLNMAGICSAMMAPIAAARRKNKTAFAAALVALGYAVATIAGLTLEWRRQYGDLDSDLLMFGILAALTGLSGIASLRAIRQRKAG